ncbi:hypothetical protein QOM21_17960 [Streptomyces sp. Pv4-95]|uniref:hypothetical protein n=1 Tax=Streptomyces sp. Pv4-95 TaxID=3049543 RepID=UPI003891E297
MHMNSAPHLLNEDREEFARILDDALRTAEYRPDHLASDAGNDLDTEQLRTMALGATSAIAACATAEYQRYVELRTALRAAPSAVSAEAADGQEDAAAGQEHVPATAAIEAPGTAGAGLAAMIAVLAPVLAGIAAILFLLIGYVLRAFGPDQAAARPLISVGWIFAALTATGALIAMGGLVVTALRNGSSSAPDVREDAADEELHRAHDEWRHALLERGLLPFLREARSDTARGPDPDPSRYVPRPHSEPKSRIPTLGYSRPDFTSPDSGSASRPRYSSPDFTSPEYGGPDHSPE